MNNKIMIRLIAFGLFACSSNAYSLSAAARNKRFDAIKKVYQKIDNITADKYRQADINNFAKGVRRLDGQLNQIKITLDQERKKSLADLMRLISIACNNQSPSEVCLCLSSLKKAFFKPIFAPLPTHGTQQNQSKTQKKSDSGLNVD